MDVHIENLSYTFNHRKHPLAALTDVTVDVASSEFIAIIGPSGCGKSTLLRLVADLLSPTQGTITLDGQPPAAMIAGKRIAWMAQQTTLLPWRTVRDNITLPQRINTQSGRRVHHVDDLLRSVGLAEFADSYPFTLSGGMQQRVALARTLALGADLWLMDEPFAALDQLTRDQITAEVLDYWRAARPTVIWVTHHIQEAVLLADRVLVMSPRPGRICADIPVTLAHPRDDTAPEFQALVRQLRIAISSGQQVSHVF
ncbi:MAG: ABC transporter ATP-binding protein [Anaerolineae bacterium]|nr:ABC transporter ATP-binding protein [Anaerolineae bacterium]